MDAAPAIGAAPAPPHDASGHTWHHPDGVLFRIVKEGTAAVVGQGYESDMPAFAGILSDQQIRDVLAFIKSTWSERERAFQAGRAAGKPREAGDLSSWPQQFRRERLTH